jgi:hypothetical protein
MIRASTKSFGYNSYFNNFSSYCAQFIQKQETVIFSRKEIFHAEHNVYYVLVRSMERGGREIGGGSGTDRHGQLAVG